jgi:hypothetical protein
MAETLEVLIRIHNPFTRTVRNPDRPPVARGSLGRRALPPPGIAKWIWACGLEAEPQIGPAVHITKPCRNPEHGAHGSEGMRRDSDV